MSIPRLLSSPRAFGRSLAASWIPRAIVLAILLAPGTPRAEDAAELRTPQSRVGTRIANKLDLTPGTGRLARSNDRQIRAAMEAVLDELEAEYGHSRRLVSMLKSKLALTGDSIIEVMGRGPTRGGKQATVFSTRADLEAHIDMVLRPPSVSLYDPRVIIGIEHISPEELEQIRAASNANPNNIQNINSSNLNRSRYGYQLRMNLGEGDLRYSYSYGFVRFRTSDDRRVMRALVSIDKVPYQAAATFAPKLLSMLERTMNLVTHDNTMHNLWHQNGGSEPGDLERFQRRMNETPWSDLPVPNNEVDSAVGHYLVMQDVLARKPKMRQRLIAGAREFEQLAENMRTRYRDALFQQALAGRNPRSLPASERRALRAEADQQARAVKSYFLTAYFNKSLTYIMAPEDHPEIRAIFERHRYLYKNRKFAEQVVARARSSKLAYPGASYAELLRDYRADLRRFNRQRQVRGATRTPTASPRRVHRVRRGR
jgi:hypothetical protein